MKSTQSTAAHLRDLARYPLRILPGGMTVRILRGELRGKKWIIGSQRHAFWLGSYETHLQKVIANEVKPGGTFYDIGANVGFYTLLAAVLIGPGRVFAFEPLPENVDFLKRHLGMNRIKNAQILEVAISNEVGFSDFYTEHTKAMGHLEPGGNHRVRTATLDSLVYEGRIPPPDYIKMDIEGAEFVALIGAKECIQKYKPKIFLATHGKAIHEECCRLLRAWNFELLPLGKPETDRAEILATPRPRS